jgi:hypothetical protein
MWSQIPKLTDQRFLDQGAVVLENNVWHVSHLRCGRILVAVFGVVKGAKGMAFMPSSA